MTFSFHPEAEEEFLDAVSYYEDCEPGLGVDLAREVRASINNALNYPLMWPLFSDEIRRCLVHRFPFGVLTSSEPDGIFIIAVMHLHRRPDYWKHRKTAGSTSS